MGLIIKNGVIYNGAESEPVVYSLDEREIGVYTDGKPLYQKTLHFTTTSSANTYISVPHNISDADIIFIHDAFVQSPSVSFILSGYRGDAAANEIIGLLNNTDNTFDYKCGASVINSDAYITLRYTKTTDTPGSGTWTPSGVKAEHYSTNEHVVGTWIDGSTVYEKTFITPTISNTTIDIDLGFAIGMGVVVHGYYLLNDTNGSMISANQWFGTDNFSWTHIELNTHLLRCRLAGYTGVGYITIRYTKTA